MTEDRNRSRVILHIDMDNYFCSVERALNPALEGRPLMVGGPEGGRGVVVAASYDVKARGVVQGMPMARARSLAPDAIVLPPRHRYYTQLSASILRILSRFTSAIEPASVDEAYLDATDLAGGFPEAARLAFRIKDTIRGELHLPSSIGIAPSRVVAKIASGYAKPDGVQVIFPDQVDAFLGPLPVSKMGGVGAKTEEMLRKIGVRTLGELASMDANRLISLFGKNGKKIRSRARGEESTAITPFYESPDPRSMSNETTLAHDTNDEETLGSVLLWLSEKLASRLRAGGKRGRCLTVKIRFSDFRTITRHRVLSAYTNDEMTIYELAKELVALHAGGKALRLVGVGMEKLVDSDSLAGELELDLEPERDKRRASIEIFDEVRRRFGRSKLKKARLL